MEYFLFLFLSGQVANHIVGISFYEIFCEVCSRFYGLLLGRLSFSVELCCYHLQKIVVLLCGLLLIVSWEFLLMRRRLFFSLVFY